MVERPGSGGNAETGVERDVRPPRSLNLPRSLITALRRNGSRYVHASKDSDACATIASYNIHKCVGIDGVFDPQRTARVISEIGADLIALQEADERLGERNGLLDLALLERSADLVPVYSPENRRSHGWHGNMILARRGVIHDVHPLRLPGLEPRGALIVDLELKGVSLRIIAAHLGLLRRSRSRQAEVLAAAAHTQLPTIMLGDLNEWRVNTRSSLLSLMPDFGPLEAVVPSFPSKFPLLALDRILARPPSLVMDIEVHNSPLARVASDHLPISARLDLEQVRLAQESVARAG